MAESKTVFPASEEKTSAPKGPPRWRSTRYILVYMISTGLIAVFYIRVSFSMVIVCMVNHTALASPRQHFQHKALDVFPQSPANETTPVADWSIHTTKQSSSSIIDDASDDENADNTDEGCQRVDKFDRKTEDGPFHWDKSLQGQLLGALYWGYCIIQVPGSYVIQRLGARVVAGVGMGVMSALYALCHPAAILSPWAVFVLRVFIGICTGLTIPAMYSVFGPWAPVRERSQMMSVAFAGQMVANASAFPLSALLCSSEFLGGWPGVFHVFAGFGFLWTLCWFLVMANAPEHHSRISAEERDFIIANRSSISAQKQKLSVPWRSILTARCFWAIAVSQFTYNWGFFLLLSNLPIFMQEVMHFDIRSNGVFSMLPYICLFFIMSGTGFMADFTVRRKYLTVTACRKVFTCVGYLVPALLLTVMSHQDCEAVGAVVVLLMVAVGFTGLANTAGFFVNPYDIAPRYATSICTATSCMAIASGIINPYLVAVVTRDKTREQWQMVFYITSGIYVFGTLFFCLFARGEVQPWAQQPTEEQEVSCPDSLDHQATQRLTDYSGDGKEDGGDDT